MRTFLGLAICVLTWVVGASGAELAVLKNGFAIRHEHRATIASTTRLFLGPSDTDYIDILTTDIERFAPDDSPAQPADKPSPIKSSEAPVFDLFSAVRETGARHGIDPDFIASVVKAESGFNPRAVSPKGARGLMQLMPDTATRLGVTNSFDPAANIEGGTQYLHELFELYNGDVVKTLAAYNAGPHRVQQYHGIPPYRETHQYVVRIINDYNRKKTAAQKPAAQKSTATKAKPLKAGGEH